MWDGSDVEKDNVMVESRSDRAEDNRGVFCQVAFDIGVRWEVIVFKAHCKVRVYETLSICL